MFVPRQGMNNVHNMLSVKPRLLWWYESEGCANDINKSIHMYTGCPRRKGPNFGRVFLRQNYTDITQNTYIQSSMVTEISNIEK